MNGWSSAERRTNARQVLFGHAAAALEHHHCGIAGQANGERDDERDRDDDENRLQQSLDEETGHVLFLGDTEGCRPPFRAAPCLSDHSTVTSVSFMRLSGGAMKPFTRLLTP